MNKSGIGISKGYGHQNMTLKGIRLSGYQEVGIRLSEYQATQKSSDAMISWYPPAYRQALNLT